MYAVTFYRVGADLRSITTPNAGTAVRVAMALARAGYVVRQWAPGGRLVC